MTGLARELARHVDTTDQRHRCVLVSHGQRLRCLDCTQTIDLRPAFATPGSTSTSHNPNPHEQCPHHRGEHADHCRACRAEQLETQRQPDWTGRRPPPAGIRDVLNAARPRPEASA